MPLFKKWRPKTIAGKILKGAVIGVGGAAAIASGVGAVAGAIGGGGLLAGALSGVGTAVKLVGKIGKGVGGGTKTVLSKVGAGAVKLLTGQNKEERGIIKEVKAEAKEAKGKMDLVAKLQRLGLSQKEAMEKIGVSGGVDIKENDGTDFMANLRSKLTGQRPETGTAIATGGNKNLLIYGGLGLAAVLLLGRK